MKHLKIYEEFDWFKTKETEYDSIYSIEKIENLLVKARNDFDNFMKNNQSSWAFTKFETTVEKIINLLEVMDKNNEGRTRYYVDKLGVVINNFDVKSFMGKNIEDKYMIKFINLIKKYNITRLSNGWGANFVVGKNRFRR